LFHKIDLRFRIGYVFILIAAIFENLYFTTWCSDAVEIWWYIL